MAKKEKYFKNAKGNRNRQGGKASESRRRRKRRKVRPTVGKTAGDNAEGIGARIGALGATGDGEKLEVVRKVPILAELHL